MKVECDKRTYLSTMLGASFFGAVPSYFGVYFLLETVHSAIDDPLARGALEVLIGLGLPVSATLAAGYFSYKVDRTVRGCCKKPNMEKYSMLEEVDTSEGEKTNPGMQNV